MYSIIAPIRRCRLEIVAHLSLPVMSRREENPMCIVCIAFTRASSKSVLSKASTVFEEVNAPSAHGAECQTFSPLRTLCDAKLVIKPMSKMSNLCLNRFSGSPVFAPFPRRICRHMSESRWHPVAAPATVFGNFRSTAVNEVKVIFAVYRTLNHDAKTMYEATLRHATTQFSSRNALTAIQIPQTTLGSSDRSKE